MLVAISIVCLLTSFKFAIEPFFRGAEVTLEEVEAFLDAPLPEEATDIEVDAKSGRGGYVKLSFKAPSETAYRFTNAICNGVLHPGYNPFDAHNTYQLLPHAYLIKARGFTYYSY